MIYGTRIIGTVGYMGGVPAVLEPFCWAWGQLIQYTTAYLCQPGEQVAYTRATISYHAAARNTLADTMEGDWLVMLDTDHAPEPDLIARLVSMADKHDIDVLSALYCYRAAPHNPVLFNSAPASPGKLEYLGDWDRAVELFQIGSAGAGALFIRKSVFDRIHTELRENPFEIRKSFSEDHAFFDRLRDLRIPAFCCPAIESPHLRIAPVTLADYHPDPSKLGERFAVDGRA